MLSELPFGPADSSPLRLPRNLGFGCIPPKLFGFWGNFETSGADKVFATRRGLITCTSRANSPCLYGHAKSRREKKNPKTKKEEKNKAFNKLLIKTI